MGVRIGCRVEALEAQLPIYWVPVLKSLYNFLRSVTQGPTIWVPGLLGKVKDSGHKVSLGCRREVCIWDHL